MKKAFTMLEFLIVLLIIGILSVAVVPDIKSNTLREAAIQLVSHIRYTQHLAMVDDKYDANDSNWFQKRWRLKFSNGIGTKNKYSYTIFDDSANNSTGNPDPVEIAVNPLDRSKKLTGGYSSNTASFINTGEKEATEEMNIGIKYGILDVDFSQTCRTASSNKLVTFDSFGRPIRGTTDTLSSSYISNILISSRCIIDLCSVSDCNNATAEEKISIAIEPETGYTHIL